MKKNILILLGVFLLGFGLSQLLTSFTTRQQIPSSIPAQTTQPIITTGTDLQTDASETVLVTKVIDGDTLEIEGGKRVRYIGMDTPETVDPRKSVQCFGREAAEENKRLVEGKRVRLEKDISQTDRFGRLLRYVYLDSLMVNEHLVRQGFAQVATFPPDVKYQELFREAQEEAEREKRGLWKACTNPSEEMPESSVNPTISTGGENSVNLTTTSENNKATTSCIIKGNISTSGEKIYHLPDCGSYYKTVIDEAAGERWFCTEDEAVKAGWRKAKNCQ